VLNQTFFAGKESPPIPIFVQSTLQSRDNIYTPVKILKRKTRQYAGSNVL
jgi:hypothetical protein